MPSLRRAIRLPHAAAMVVGTIIGASIFVQPAEVTREVHTVPGVLLVWLAAGALTLIGSLVCAELASTFTRTGGVYVYLSESLHPMAGFLWGWSMLLVMHSGIIAAIATVFARFLARFISLGDWGQQGAAIAIILVLSAVNYVGVQHGSRLQTWLTWIKLGAVALIVLMGVVFGAGVPEHFVPTSGVAEESVGGILTALAAALFAYGGWHMVTYSAEETVDPQRTIPRALLLGTVVVTVAYLLMNTVYLWVLPMDTVASSTRVAADFADRLLGRGGGAAMSVLVLLSAFGALSGIVLAGPRVYFAMAREGQLFEWLDAVHPRYGTPHRAIVLQALWSSVLVGTGTFKALFTRVIYTEWIFFALVAASLMVLRRRPRAGLTRQYSMPGYPILPILFIIASLAVAVNAMRVNVTDSIIGLALVLTGVPIYLLRRASRPSPERHT